MTIPKSVEILSSAGDIILFHLMLNEKAMNVCHMLGYNGFKRKHRCNTKKFMKYLLKIENQSIDGYQTVSKIDGTDFIYCPLDLKSHLSAWKLELDKAIINMGFLNNQYFSESGIICKQITKPLKCMFKDREKVCRWIKRFEDTAWMGHDLHVLDDKLHCKYKKKESRK